MLIFDVVDDFVQVLGSFRVRNEPFSVEEK